MKVYSKSFDTEMLGVMLRMHLSSVKVENNKDLKISIFRYLQTTIITLKRVM